VDFEQGRETVKGKKSLEKAVKTLDKKHRSLIQPHSPPSLPLPPYRLYRHDRFYGRARRIFRRYYCKRFTSSALLFAFHYPFSPVME
jgi:hypothetical protein